MSEVVGEFDLGAGWDDLASSDGDMGEIMSMDGDLVSEGDGDEGGREMEDVVIKPGSQESEAKEGEKGVKPVQRKYRFHGTFIFVTYAQSKIADGYEFYERLRGRMPEGTSIFGGQEKHEDGNPHYHVVMKFPKRIHWSDARSHLRLEGDTDAIYISGLARGQSKESFVEGTQAYCEKDGNPFIFGNRIDVDVGKEGDRKRKFREVDEEEDYETSKRMLRELDPYRFIFSYGSVDVRRDRRGQTEDEVWNDFGYQLEVNGQARRVTERIEWEIKRRGRGEVGFFFFFWLSFLSVFKRRFWFWFCYFVWVVHCLLTNWD